MRGYNRIRRGIKRFFPSRRCFVLPLPTADSAALTHVERLSDSELAPAFVSAVRDLFSFVLERTSGRTIAGRSLDGSSTSPATCTLPAYNVHLAQASLEAYIGVYIIQYIRVAVFYKVEKMLTPSTCQY